MEYGSRIISDNTGSIKCFKLCFNIITFRKTLEQPNMVSSINASSMKEEVKLEGMRVYSLF